MHTEPLLFDTILLEKQLYWFFLFGSTGVWTQGFTFAKQVLYHLSLWASDFCSFLKFIQQILLTNY
jgi:hypothetical protein